MSDEPKTSIPTAVPSVAPSLRRIVFVCVHNASRSQMAEGIARAMAPPGAEVWSAGTSPRTVHPLAIEVMAEMGIDLAAHRSKSLDEVPWQSADTIVSVCSEGEDACPVVGPAVSRIHWPLPDPSNAPDAERLQAFRRTRDELRWRVASLWPRGDRRTAQTPLS